MHCKKCGKALGTDKGVCPFCGAMMTKEQLEIYGKEKRENLRPELITEKYGEKPNVYSKQQNNQDNKLIGILIVLGILLIILVIALLNVLK